MTRPAKLGIAMGALIFAALVIALLYQPAPPVIVLPNPNGYDDFLQAVQVVVPNPGTPNLPMDQLRAQVEDNAKALALARQGLTKSCRVPVEYDQAYGAKSLPRLASFKQVAYAFVAEGKLAAKEGRTADAVRSYLDCVKFGAASDRGGLLIEKLVGLACQAMGMKELRGLSGGLSATNAQRVLDEISNIHRQRESPADWLSSERLWSRFAFKDWRSTLTRWFTRKMLRESQRRSIEKYSRLHAELQLLRGDLALKLFSLEKGRYPDRLAELVPRYFESVLIDPFSNQPLVYRLQENTYLLYSIGPDGNDDGGKPLPMGGTKGDILSTGP